MLWKGFYKNVRKRLNDWLKASSDNVGDLALDLTNRALERLWSEADWEHLLKRQNLTVTSLSATLPTDFGKIVAMYFDAFGYGRPSGYFCKDGDLIYGYKVTTSFAKATGWAQQVITFYYAQQYTPVLVYKAALERLTGTTASGETDPNFTAGEYNEYLAFPEELVVLMAQMIHSTENSFDDNEFKVIERNYLRELSKFKAQVQGVNADYRFDIKDDVGNKVRIAAFDASGMPVGPRLISPNQDVRWSQ
jgi:hypothetical protein